MPICLHIYPTFNAESIKLILFTTIWHVLSLGFMPLLLRFLIYSISLIRNSMIAVKNEDLFYETDNIENGK